MKRFLAGIAAISATLIATQALANDAVSRSWNGCYAGIQGGYAWGEYQTNRLVRDTSPDGGFVGGTLGCNFQTNNIVWGLEGDLAWASIANDDAKIDWIGSARLRAGIAASPSTLFYVTAGLGAGHSELKSVWFTSPKSNTHIGWVAGAGIEWMLGNNWTAKVEYLHYDLGEEGYTTTNVRAGMNIDTVKVGVNYLFNSGL